MAQYIIESQHRDCGEQVVWIKRADDVRFMPPMDRVRIEYEHSLVFASTRTGRVLTDVEAFTPHVCDPEKVTAEAERRERDEQARKDYDAAWRAAVATAVRRPCPQCGAQVGDRCRNMRKNPKNEFNKWPHPDRLPEDWDGPGRPAENTPPTTEQVRDSPNTTE